MDYRDGKKSDQKCLKDFVEPKISIPALKSFRPAQITFLTYLSSNSVCLVTENRDNCIQCSKDEFSCSTFQRSHIRTRQPRLSKNHAQNVLKQERHRIQ